ncbi:MAG: MFS transporter [Christensenellaceae bacterium]|nr:MFS transporter [Christensenellaceae bacterium]
MNSAEEQQNRLLGCVLFTFFASGAASQPLGSFIPFLRQTYGFSYDLSGILLSCQSIGNLAAVFIAGILPSLLGRRRSILATAVWMAVGYLIFVSGLGAAPLLIAACLMTGIARGGNSNFANTMVSTLPGDKATRGYNLLHGAFAMGALLSPLVLVAVVRVWPDAGWRVVAGLLCLLCVSQLVVYARMPLPEEKQARGIKTVDRSFLRIRQFWLGSFMLFCYISTEYAIVGWLVTYFQDAGYLSADLSQMMNSLLWLVIFCGRMIGAAITGKISRNKLLLIDGFGLFVFFMLLFFSRTPGLIVPALMGTGLFMATIYPTAFAFGSDHIKGNDFGCSIMSLTGSAGGVITPALVGFVAEKAGIQAGMGVVVALTGLLLGGILVSVWSVRQRRGA